MSKIIDGKKIRNEMLDDFKREVKQYMIKPCVAVIQIGDDPASNTYIKSKEKASNDIGLYFKHIKFNENVKEIEVINKILELNNDEYVHGILLQLPLPEGFNQDKLINYISRSKDVDGLTDINLGKLFNNKPGMVSCTPLGIMTLFDKYGVDVEGKNVVIVGRSKLVGKPMLGLLLNRNATVTICHSKTVNLKMHTKNADILIVAVGKKHFITKDMVKEDAVVIDVGINKDEDGLHGDVDFDSVKDIASLITPVPGGVGPMTVASLMSNVLEAYRKQMK